MDSKVKASIISCILLAMVSISYAAGEVTCTRDLPASYEANQTLTVTLNLEVDEAHKPNGVIVKDYVPAGWTVVSATPTFDNFNSATGEVKWVFFGGQVSDTGMDISYQATVPSGETGAKTFSGQILYNDPVTGDNITQDIGGDTQISEQPAPSPSAANSTVDATTPVPADGTSTSTITITAKDALGNPIPGIPDVNVVVASTGTGNTIVQPTTATNPSGQTTATMSSTVAESKTISATINGTAITDTASVVFTTPSPSAGKCTVEATTPVVANGTNTTTITITAKSAYDTPIPGIAASDIVVSSTGTGNTITQPTAATNASGQTTATMKSTVGETKTVSATIRGTPITDTAEVVFGPGPVSADQSTVEATTPVAASVDPNGPKSTITITAKDAYSNPIQGIAPENIVVSSTGTGNTITQPTTATDASGQTTATIHSTKPETKTITVTISSTAITDDASVVFTGWPALTIEKSDDQDPVDPNTEVAYTITYGNVGLGAASNTVIVETLPTNLIYVSSTGDTDGGVYNSTARTITWPIGTLNAEDVNNTVTFTARVANTGSILDGGIITNSALTIDCDETDPAGQLIPETTTVNDKKAPETSGHIPDPNSIQVARDTIIQLHVTDGGSGVDYGDNTVTIQVEGDLIYDGANETSPGVYDSNSLHPNQAVRGICRRVGSDADYTFVFQPSTLFDYEQKVDVTVDAEDKAGNEMTQENYHFYTVMRSFGKNAKVNTDTGTLIQNNSATVTDSEGNIWIVWDQTNAAGNTDIFIGRLPVDANAFEASTSVANDSNNQRNPAIAVDGNDVVYVAWENDDPNGHWDIFVSASANGTTWSTPVKVDVGDPCNTTDQTSPAIAIDRAAPNSIYAAWQDTRAGDKDIWLATSTDGISWTETQVTTDATDQTGPIVAVDPNNVVYVAWTDSRNLATTGMDIYGASSAEVPWTNVALVNTDRNELSPAGAASEFMHLLWVADANGYSDILYGNDANDPPLVGASIIDPNEPNAVTVGPAVAITTRGSSTKVFACWEDSRNVVNNNGDTDIYFAEGRSPFGTNILVNDDTGVHRQAKPAIGVDKNGNPYIVWVDNRSGNDDIYTAGSTCLGSALPTTVTDVNGVVTVQATADLQVTIPDLPDGIDANDIRITEVSNPPQMPAATGGFGLVYSFGPSGLQFSPPATIRIPLVNDPGYSVYRVFRYDPGDLTSPYFPWSEDGIHNPATKVPGQTPYLEVQVDHFSLFSTGGAAAGASYHHGDGGCALSPSGGATPAEFLLPFAGYVFVLLVITCADAYRRRSSSGKH